MWNRINKPYKRSNSFEYFRNNRKQKRIQVHCKIKGENITTDIEIAQMLNNHFSYVFISQNLNNVPDFNLSYRKKIEAPMTYFRINEEVIKKIINQKLSKFPGLDEISPKIF